MVQNSVPIQFGWGNYNDNASATFENCKIWGSAGRGSDVRIIDNAGSSSRNKTVVMNKCTIDNPNGTLFRTAVAVNSVITSYSIHYTKLYDVGVTVMVKGTTNGVITDVEGKYNLKIFV